MASAGHHKLRREHDCCKRYRSLAPGMDADVVVIDPEAEYVIDPKEFVSKGKNTPFGGKKVKGKVMATVCGGKIVYEAE